MVPSKSPLDAKRMVTAIAYSPHHPNVIVAGTQPAALFRSEDGGKTWRDLNAAMYEAVALRFGSKDRQQPDSHYCADVTTRSG